MSNVLPLFKSAENFNTVTYRDNNWGYNFSSPGWRRYRKPEDRADIGVFGSHSDGKEPFYSVEMRLHVDGRSGTENLKLYRSDCIALSEMFAAIAADMSDDLSDD